MTRDDLNKARNTVEGMLVGASDEQRAAIRLLLAETAPMPSAPKDMMRELVAVAFAAEGKAGSWDAETIAEAGLRAVFDRLARASADALPTDEQIWDAARVEEGIDLSDNFARIVGAFRAAVLPILSARDMENARLSAVAGALTEERDDFEMRLGEALRPVASAPEALVEELRGVFVVAVDSAIRDGDAATLAEAEPFGIRAVLAHLARRGVEGLPSVDDLRRVRHRGVMSVLDPYATPEAIDYDFDASSPDQVEADRAGMREVLWRLAGDVVDLPSAEWFEQAAGQVETLADAAAMREAVRAAIAVTCTAREALIPSVDQIERAARGGYASGQTVLDRWERAADAVHILLRTSPLPLLAARDAALKDARAEIERIRRERDEHKAAAEGALQGQQDALAAYDAEAGKRIEVIRVLGAMRARAEAAEKELAESRRFHGLAQEEILRERNAANIARAAAGAAEKRRLAADIEVATAYRLRDDAADALSSVRRELARLTVADIVAALFGYESHDDVTECVRAWGTDAERVLALIRSRAGIREDPPVADPAERAKAVARELRWRGIHASDGVYARVDYLGAKAYLESCWFSKCIDDERLATMGPLAIADEIQREEATRAKKWGGDT